MEKHKLSQNQIDAYGEFLHREERASGTIKKYLRDVEDFFVWLDGRPVTKEMASGWKEHLLFRERAPSTINGTLAALNGLFHFLGWDDCRVRFLKIQRRLFREQGRDLSRIEYERLLRTAQ